MNGNPDTSSKSIVVFGAGIAGLTVAHELSLRGHKVSVYEVNSEAGGFFRSGRDDSNMPTEYSWHGFGPWYHNLFDLMKQIPFDKSGSIYQKALSRPIDFGIFPDQDSASFYDKGISSIPRMFWMTRWEWIKWSWLMLKSWTANTRSDQVYSTLNAAEQWRPLLSEHGWKTWRSCFGPWIGSDWTRVSLHTAGEFFCKQLTTRPVHLHDVDQEGPAWAHGSGDGWLVLRGPSSEYWFTKWVTYLETLGVIFSWKKRLDKFNYDGKHIISAYLDSGEKIEADMYVMAVNPFEAAKIVDRTPAIGDEKELKLFAPLIQDGPHTQVSFRIAFSEAIYFPRETTAVVLADTEFNLTLFAQEQAWHPEVDLGQNIKSLWTGTSCAAEVPGRLFNEPVVKCTKDQFIEEIKAQIFDCSSLNELIKEANHGRSLAEFNIVKIEVWHEWIFSSEGIHPMQPKWVTTTNTQRYLPEQTTTIPNLFLAGAHTRTEADVWSIEGAVESGRRAAHAIDPAVKVLPQYKPLWLRFIASINDVFYASGLPHVLDILFPVLVIVSAIFLALLAYQLSLY